MPSIRRRITVGYYLFAASMIVLAVFAYASLRFLEQRLDWGDAVSAFFDTTLEMRRFEKNYFLYGMPDDLVAARNYAQQALELLDEHGTAFRNVASSGDMGGVRRSLVEYDASMARLQVVGVAHGETKTIEEDIRELGRVLADTAERIGASERASMRELLNSARLTLVSALIAVTVASLFLAHFLSHAIARPLRELEQDVQEVGHGRLESLPIRSRDREIVRFSDAFNRTLRELELRRRHLLQAEKLASLGTLVSGVAHELNNPLSNISISTQLLLEELDAADPDQVRAWLGDIEEQTDRARCIVSTLLEFSRESAFSVQATCLRTVLDKTVTLLRTKIPKDSVIEIDVPNAVIIDADAQKLQQVFVNLIGNALEAGGKRLQVRFIENPEQIGDPPLEDYVWDRLPSNQDSANDAVFIQVSDDGPGIPIELLPKIFDPFFTTKDVGYGSGLGLYICEQIVNQHDGSIGVASAPGRGTSFLILLPRRHQERLEI